MISKPRGAPFAAWITGWISIVGHVAATTALRFIIPSSVIHEFSADWRFMPSSSFACANFISIAATLRSNYHPNSHKTIGIYAAVLFLQGMMQCDYSLIPDQPRCRYCQHIWFARAQALERLLCGVALPCDDFSRYCRLGKGPDAPKWQVRLPDVRRRHWSRRRRMVATSEHFLRRGGRKPLCSVRADRSDRAHVASYRDGYPFSD